MSVLDRMAALLGYSKAQQGVLYPAWLTASADAERYTLIDEGRRAAPEQVYRKLSWVHIAVTRLAQTGAVAGFEVSRRVGDDEKGIVNHPFEVLLARPNPLQSRFEFLEATLAYHALGEAFWYLARSGPDAPPR